ncbi:thiamine diphosphokinase [Chloroflexales bacterium ZM16-3]|nr:thiamine diphosphokinase [Chloroflexales bacterium ZM16-3]
MHAIIVANAPDFDANPFAKLLASADLVVAADGGGNALRAAGITPHVVIGDLDSLEPDVEGIFRAAGAEVIRHPAEKDETDLELALLLAVGRGAGQIDILGAIGGRWDQGLANVAMLALPELAGLRVRLLDVAQEAFLVRGAAEIYGVVGDTVSLLPLGGPAHGVTTRGLYYPLDGATLRFERSRGVSNLITEPPAHVSVGEGLLLMVRHHKQ